MGEGVEEVEGVELAGGGEVSVGVGVGVGIGALDVASADRDTAALPPGPIELSPRTRPMITMMPTTIATARTLGIATGIRPRAGRGLPRCVPGRVGS